MVISRTLLSTLLLACVAALGGCDNSSSPGAFGTPPVTSAAGNTMEFRGERACVDCQGIQSWLRLEQRGEDRQYTLVEVYRADGDERRFEDKGRWESSGDLLRLQSGLGGERVYTLLPDNRLRAADTRGLAVPAMADEVLVPTSYSNER